MHPWELLEAVEDTAKELHAHEGEDEHDHEHQEEEVRHERQRLAQGHDDYVLALPHVRMRRSTRSTRNVRMIRKKDRLKLG